MTQGPNHQGPVTTPPSGAPVEILPENIAARSGMPREAGVDHSLHDVADRATTQGREANARLQAGLQDTTEQAREGARNLRDQAADRASELKNRVSEAADTVRAAREQASDTYEDARSWAEDRYETHRQRASDLADRGYRRLHEGRTATEQFVTENPLLVGVVGLAAGLLLGALLPRTRQEDRALGPYADDLRDQGIRYARDLTHRGRAFVETALDPENLDAAVKRTNAQGGPQSGQQGGPATGSAPGRDETERTAHRL
ncbi:DUF883 family protein [Methylobacterium sp. R2-1]|uniref:DUF883 family protein n=1 Tax=Methylobacterium sp. R2-1 TaxID=2587064 RepID=UPI001610A8DC|nr:DUF883 family protein [Methylobacterium sp. R2-1]MBB2960304.1 ElaB/YqjD/DUF883 family membrane-anchored ribosome-binding protein [Methylobacterium sp. R2-1]